jgi:MFS family permease
LTFSVSRRTGTLLVVACLTVMAAATIAPALPRMADAFAHVPRADLLTKLVLTAPALAIALGAPAAGAIIDRFGRLTLLRGSLLLYGLAGSAPYLLDDLYAILATRVALGFAIAGTMTTMTALSGDYFTGEARGRFAGLQSFAMSIGAVVSVGLGGVLADVDWRLPFLLYLAGWAVLVPTALFLDEPRRGGSHAPAPTDAARLDGRKLTAVYAITFFAVAVFYMTAAQLPFLVREIGVASSAAAGAAVATSSLVSAFGSAAFVRFRAGSGVLGVYAWAFAFMAAGYALIGVADSYFVVIAGVVLSGFGVGLFFPNSNLWVLAIAPAALRGRVVGGLTASIFLAQFCSPILTQPVVALHGLDGAFVAAAAALAVVTVALTVVRQRR